MNGSPPDLRSRDVALAVGVLAIMGAEVGAELTRQLTPNELDTYLIQLFATFIGALLAAAVGLSLFSYQVKEIDSRRSRQLLEALAGELQAVLDVLEGEPSIERARPESYDEGPETIAVVLAHFEPIACEEAIRNAVLGAQDTFSLSLLSRSMRMYNFESERFNSARYGPSVWKQDHLEFEILKRVDFYQGSIVRTCRATVERMAQKGIPIPQRLSAMPPLQR